MKTFIKWPGGKTRELKNIRNYYPSKKVDVFIEPFLGSGAVFLDFQNAKKYYINDISTDLINIYKAIKKQDSIFFREIKKLNEDWKELDKIYQKSEVKSLAKKIKADINKMEELFIRKLKKNKNKSEVARTVAKQLMFINVRNKFNSIKKPGYKKSAYWFFICEYAFSSLFQYNKKGQINIPYAGKSYNSKNLDKKIMYMQSGQLVEKMQNTKIFNMCAKEFIDKIPNEKSFIFLDPPYDSGMIYNGKRNLMPPILTICKKFLNIKKSKTLLVISSVEKEEKYFAKYKIDIKNFKYSINFKNRNKTEIKHLYITKRG